MAGQHQHRIKEFCCWVLFKKKKKERKVRIVGIPWDNQLTSSRPAVWFYTQISSTIMAAKAAKKWLHEKLLSLTFLIALVFLLLNVTFPLPPWKDPWPLWCTAVPNSARSEYQSAHYKQTTSADCREEHPCSTHAPQEHKQAQYGSQILKRLLGISQFAYHQNESFFFLLNTLGFPHPLEKTNKLSS